MENSKRLTEILRNDDEVHDWLLRFEDSLRDDNLDAAIVEAKKFRYYYNKYKTKEKESAEAIYHIYHSLIHQYRNEKYNTQSGDINDR